MSYPRKTMILGTLMLDLNLVAFLLSRSGWRNTSAGLPSRTNLPRATSC